MKEQNILAFCIVIVLTSQSGVAASDTCPIWTVESNDTVSNCKCGSNISEAVFCDNKTLDVFVELYHCMTYNEVLNKTVVGHCMYNLFDVQSRIHRYYWKLPRLKHRNNTALCQFIEKCDHHNSCTQYQYKTGPMCSRCVDGYASPVYSYSLACVECKDYKYNWLKYIAVAFLPLTVFYIIVILFRISATSGVLNGYVLMCQLTTTPVYVRLFSRFASKLEFGFYFAWLGVWNLDFFRGIYRPFCLHPKLSMLQILMLDYVIGLYPLILVIVTYICVKLHNRYSLVVRLWSPFYKCFALIRNEWDITRSLVGAFATFILLSYVKILNVSFQILTPNTLYDINGNPMRQRFLYYDGTYEYFGKDHIPYALLALLMLLVFNIIPLVLLCLYPCRCFHKCLNYYSFRCLTLHIFMDTFHGCYKLQSRDCRYFAALYLFLRLLNHFLIALTTGPFYYPLSGLTFIMMAILVATVRPHKSPWLTFADLVFFATLSALFIGIPNIRYVLAVDNGNNLKVLFVFIFTASVLSVPIVYGFALLVYFVIPRQIQTKVKSICQHFKYKILNTVETVETLPYRFGHSDEYPPLLPIQPVTNQNMNQI